VTLFKKKKKEKKKEQENDANVYRCIWNNSNRISRKADYCTNSAIWERKLERKREREREKG